MITVSLPASSSPGKNSTIGDGSVWYCFGKTVPNGTVPNGIILLFSLQLEFVEVVLVQFELGRAEVDELGTGQDGVIGIHQFGLDEGYVAHHLAYLGADGDLVQL